MAERQRDREREIEREKKKEQESAETISGLKSYLVACNSQTSNNQTRNTKNTGSMLSNTDGP